MLKVAYVCPSCNPVRAKRTFAKWKAMGYGTAVLLDAGMKDSGADLETWTDDYRGYWAECNALCRLIEADIIVLGGDDIDPDPNHRADEIAAEFIKHFPNLFGVMQPTGDDLQGTDKICGSPWLGRGWIERAYGGNGATWPEYRSFFGDEELQEVAMKLGVLWQRPDLIQFHDHWTRHGGPTKTDYQIRNNQYWGADKALFGRRQASNFPGHEALPCKPAS